MKTLFPFQADAVRFTLARRGTLLAHEMGLGKTLTSATAACHWLCLNPEWRCLVLCPASLKGNWIAEFQEAIASFPITFEADIGMAEGSFFPEARIVVINYDLIWRPAMERHLFGEPGWDIIIADESQYTKKLTAKRTKAFLKLKARRKIALSGTPVTSKPADLFPTLHWLDPVAWPNFYAFAYRYCAAKKVHNRLDTSGASNTKELHHRLTSTVMHRLRKADVLPDLPPATRQIIPLPPEASCKPLLDEQLKIWRLHEPTIRALREARETAKRNNDEAAYRAAALQLKAAFTASMSSMAKLRQQLGVTKIPVAVQFIRDAMDSGAGKIVVFAHHLQVIGGLLDGLSAYNPIKIDGSIPALERTELVNKFQSDPDCRIFVIGIMAGGVGLTLTASNHVVFVESDWLPSSISQAEARCIRIGQKNNVLVQHLVYDGSLDAYMLKKVIARQAVADAVVDGKTVNHSVTREQTDYKAHGSQMTPRQQGAVHEAIALLAGKDREHRRFANGIGFAAAHAEIGKKLAMLTDPSPAQYGLMLELARKYSAQLPPSIRCLFP